MASIERGKEGLFVAFLVAGYGGGTADMEGNRCGYVGGGRDEVVVVIEEYDGALKVEEEGEEALLLLSSYGEDSVGFAMFREIAIIQPSASACMRVDGCV